jgi:hypothetical protein
MNLINPADITGNIAFELHAYVPTKPDLDDGEEKNVSEYVHEMAPEDDDSSSEGDDDL